MKRVLDPERRAAIAARLRFYSDLGVYDFLDSGNFPFCQGSQV